MTVIITPEILDLRNGATMIFALIAACMCFAYVLTNQRREAKKPVYAIGGLGFTIVFVSYLVGVILGSSNFYLLRSGWLSFISLVYLALFTLALVRTDWKKK